MAKDLQRLQRCGNPHPKMGSCLRAVGKPGLVISSGQTRSLWDSQVESEVAKVAQNINLWWDRR